MATLAYVLVTLRSGAERDVCNKVSNFEEVVQVDELYGEYDAVVKVQVEDLAQLDKFLTDRLRALPDIFVRARGLNRSMILVLYSQILNTSRLLPPVWKGLGELGQPG